MWESFQFLIKYWHNAAVKCGCNFQHHNHNTKSYSIYHVWSLLIITRQNKDQIGAIARGI